MTTWNLPEERLRELLLRAHNGENPEDLLIEEYANSDHRYVEADAEDTDEEE